MSKPALPVLTHLQFLVLGVLLYTGALALALAGAAAVAMRTAAQAVSRMIFETNHLYEASLYVDMYRTCLADARWVVAAVTDADPTVGLVFYDLKHCLRSVDESAPQPAGADPGHGPSGHVQGLTPDEAPPEAEKPKRKRAGASVYCS